MANIHLPLASNLHLSLSCNDYDVTRLIVDGIVQAQGIDLTVVPLVSGERHRRYTRNLEFDVCELQVGVYLAWKERGAPFTAIPVFPLRKFCHSHLLVMEGGGIERPEDLRGRTIGMDSVCNPASIWILGMLNDEFGVTPRSLKLRTNTPEQVPGWEPPAGFDIQRLPRGTTTASALSSGQVDAYIHPRSPRRYVNDPAGGAKVRKLWPNHREVEVDYCRRTRLFPIRHTVVVRNEVLQRDPWVAQSLVKAFALARDLGIKHVGDNRTSFLPWYAEEQQAQVDVLGPNAWAYDVEDNRLTLETMARYAAECGATQRPLTIEEMFAETTLGRMQFEYGWD